MIDDPGPLTGRFTNFTPLNTPIDQVLMQIKNERALTFPDKLKGDPNKRGLGINITISTETTVTTCLNAMT